MDKGNMFLGLLVVLAIVDVRSVHIAEHRLVTELLKGKADTLKNATVFPKHSRSILQVVKLQTI